MPSELMFNGKHLEKMEGLVVLAALGSALTLGMEQLSY